MKTIIPIFLFVLFLISCSDNKECKPSQEEGTPLEVAVIYPQDSIAFVLDGFEDSISNSAYFHVEDGIWFFNAEGTDDASVSIPVKLQSLGDLNASLPALESWYWLTNGKPKLVDSGIVYEYIPNDTILNPVPYKLWWNASCGKVMPGFKAECMRTFGVHKILGNSMDWSVREHTVCGPGKSFCLEKKRSVGMIRYFESDDCSDSIYQSVSIDRFTCN